MSAEIAAPEESASPAPVIQNAEPARAEPHWSDSDPATKGDATAKRFASPAEVLKSYKSIQQVMSGDGAKAPGEKATAEQWDEFYTKMGKPGEAGAYFEGIDRPKVEGWNDDLAVTVAKAMHEQGLSAKQGNAILKTYMESAIPDPAAIDAARAQIQANQAAELREEWKGSYDQRLVEANNAGKVVWGDGWNDLLKTELAGGGVLGNHPAFAKGLARHGGALGEAKVLGVTSASAHNYTPGPGGSAQARIDELFGIGKDTEAARAVTDSGHPKHAEFIAIRADLYAQAYPEG